jgi:hypothetical protein
VGVYFALYNADLAFSPNSAKYTQWPAPPALSLNDMLDDTPVSWGNYVFDPATTFSDIAVTGVRRGDDGPENYYKISHTANNRFEVRVENPGGTVVNDAPNVRLNLYLAARGIGEPWHRLDTETVLDGDCSASTWASSLISKSEVCTDSTSLPDISTKTLTEIVSGTAQYTVKNGTPMNRLGGQLITVNGGTNNWFDVLEWNTTNTQDDRFTEVIVGGMTYRRQHACMKAEAIDANDPNSSNNMRQVNMDFICVQGGGAGWSFFNLGWAGFGKYEPDRGKKMFLQVVRKNMDERAGWKYQLEGVERLREDVFVAELKGRRSLSPKLGIIAPKEEVLGKTLKQNLIIPPKAGGRNANVRIPSGVSPVYVKVEAGSTLWISNYSFDERDIQYVDLDGEGFLPSNGPDGLSLPFFDKLLKRVDERFRILLAPDISVGALVGSFNNFRTAFKIGGGVQVKVPEGATYLALAINDLKGLYNDNNGKGFRVKVIQRPGKNIASGAPAILKASFVSEAMAEKHNLLQVMPISEVMPTLCINGYEDTGQTRNFGRKPHELFRYIGNVCWGIINVYPEDRSKKPDQGDRFVEDGKPPIDCGRAKLPGFAFASMLTVIGIVLIRRRALRRGKSG